MKLHTSPLSPAGKRARVCAAELGLALDVHNLDFAKGEARAPAYLGLNPMGKVPTLDDDGFVLWESAAILCYLASHQPSPLWPTEPRAQADLLRWLFFCSCHIDPPFTTLVVERFIKARRQLPADEHLVGAAVEQLGRFVPVLEQQLAGRDFITGPALSLADIALGCTLELSGPLGYDLSRYPSVDAWLKRLQARPTWR